MINKAVLVTILCVTIYSSTGLEAQTINTTTSSTISSQSSKVQMNMFGYVNSNELLELVPGKVAATNAIADLNKKYKDELTLMQNDYNKKYADFITYQSSMSQNIRLRRMQELHELEQNINSFMKVAQEDVASQEKQLINPLRQKLKDAIEEVGKEQNLVCIYDLADPSVAFVTPNAIDVTPFVKQKLKIK